ncbi:MAG TPA: carboxypeptidase regulatory-like domain-containing protein [Candidatus Acidoferrum sp.]|nr:carboxypeptidase regulatory-like domain-containing protein [Candidatus Acidoferrum sp.]
MRKQAIMGCVLVLCLVFGICATTSLGQAVFGSIIGTVTDPQGNVVAGAKVTVTSTTKSFTYDTTTNESGNYSVTHLIPDTYKVHVEAPGFKTVDIPSVSVSADSAANINAQLQVGAVTQTVEVTGDIPQLQTDRADVDVEFSQKYVEDLPVLNRNFTSFELLSPGTQKLPGFNHAATENPQGGGQINVNGQHFSGTNFELDGTDNQDPILGIIVVNPNLDAVAETKIALQDYDAESGKATSGVIRVQTKSGSNELHGSGFYYHRDSAQQARDPFLNKPGVALPSAVWKQYGGSVGGPIIKNKLFVFGDYQGTNQTSGISNLYTVPTTEVVKTCNPATNGASDTVGFCNLGEYLNAFGPPVAGVPSGQVYQPGTFVPSLVATSPCFDTPTNRAAALLSGNCRAPFAGNKIPIGMIGQNVGNVLALFPTPRSSDVNNNFVANGSGPFKQNSFDTRIDYSAPRNYQVFGRFSLDYFSLSGAGGLGPLGSAGFGPGGLGGSSTVHNYSLASGFTKPLGTKLLTDFRFGYFKYNPKTAYPDQGTASMDALGFPCLNSTKIQTVNGAPTNCTTGTIQGPPTTGGLSAFKFNNNGGNNPNGALGSNVSDGSFGFGDGLSPARCNCPLTESEQQFQWVSNWTLSHGNHTIKFGTDFRFAENLRVPSDQNRAGILFFDQQGTGNAGSNGLALATFLLGDVTSFQRYVSVSLNAAERQKRWFSYVQDSWRISPKLTLTYGVRWEIYFPETVNAKGNGGFANLENGLIKVAGFGGVASNGNVANTYKAVAPRLSAAYQFDSKTVMRLGYGRGFDIGVFGSNFGHVVTQNLPVLARQDLSDTSFNTAATNNRSAIFTLNQGPTPFNFAPILGAISGGTLPIDGIDGLTTAGARPLVQRLPTIDQWNATVQRQITPTLNLTVSYIGNKGTHVFAGNGPSYNNNEPAVISGTNPLACTKDPVTMKFNCSLAGFTALSPSSNRRRLFLNGVPAFTYPTFSFTDAMGVSHPTPPCCAVDTTYYGNDADNKYNALQVKAEKRISYGLQFIAHYTFSHAYQYDAGYFSVDKKLAWGPNGFNRNQVFVANTIYELPIGKGKKYMSDAGRITDLAIGGWQISNTLTYGTGLPFTPSIGECGTLTDAGPCRPDAIRGAGKLHTGITHVNGATFWYTPVAALAYPQTLAQQATDLTGLETCSLARPTSGPFALPGCGQIGNVGFDSYRGPHAFYDDAAVSKTFTITERVKAQFRFDAYNLFNHPVLNFPGNTCVDCGGSAGQITDIEADSAPGAPVGMRQLQFGVRVTF